MKETYVGQSDLDLELDDYESSPFATVKHSDHSYLKSMWGGFRGTTKAIAEDTVMAHGMVQSFVNAFARDGRYVVSFDASTSTAGTDMKAREVVITPSPIADRNLTAEEAGLILTGLAVHEISHPRYGRMTAQAVERSFPSNPVAFRLSNLLDDIRIEQRFVADYPGYAGIFDPTLNYVGARGTDGGKKLRKQKVTAPVNLAIAATRYPSHSDWSDPAVAREFKWWRAWADRWAVEDAPKRHVDAIREALAHIVNVKQAPPPAPASARTGEPQEGGAEPGGDEGGNDASQGTQVGDEDAGDDAPADDDAATQSGPGDAMSDDALNRATNRDDVWHDTSNPLEPACVGKAVDEAAADGDATRAEIYDLKKEAQEIVEAARNQEPDGHGSTVDVNRSTRGLIQGASDRPTRGSDLVSRLIRNAIIQSRTGHMAVDPYKRTGRLDQKGLVRIAHGDFRTFEKRTAPSVGKYLVWAMVDASASMEGYALADASRVAHSIASATSALPSVRMAVWAWSSGFRPSSADASVAKVWDTGQDTKQIFKMANIKTGGTPDSAVMSWAARAIKKAASKDETPVIVFISDGQGYYDMNERVAEARAMGVIVVGVAFGSGMEMEKRFGRGGYVDFEGSIEKTGKPLARMIVKTVTKQEGAR